MVVINGSVGSAVAIRLLLHSCILCPSVSDLAQAYNSSPFEDMAVLHSSPLAAPTLAIQVCGPTSEVFL